MSHEASQLPSKYLVAIFNDDEQILSATKAVRGAGLPIYDCFTPYAVHG